MTDLEDPRVRIVADHIRKALAYRLGVDSLGPLDQAIDLDWLLLTAHNTLRALDAAASSPRLDSACCPQDGRSCTCAYGDRCRPGPGPDRSFRCPAHGALGCNLCSRTTVAGFDADDPPPYRTCRGCNLYSTRGVHAQACPYRVHGKVS